MRPRSGCHAVRSAPRLCPRSPRPMRCRPSSTSGKWPFHGRESSLASLIAPPPSSCWLRQSNPRLRLAWRVQPPKYWVRSQRSMPRPRSVRRHGQLADFANTYPENVATQAHPQLHPNPSVRGAGYRWRHCHRGDYGPTMATTPSVALHSKRIRPLATSLPAAGAIGEQIEAQLESPQKSVPRAGRGL